MRVLLAPDKFKGTLSATEVAEAMKKGLEKNIPGIKISLNPVADGGEGTLDTILTATGGERVFITVTGPYGKTVEACYGILPKKSSEPLTAIIEMAQASGLSLVKGIKKPLKANSFGTGELIKSALDKGCQKILITVGGSATNDAGTGALQALGVKFLNKKSKPLSLGGKQLWAITHIDQSSLYKKAETAEFIIATDVDNPFYGPHGAVNTYAEQKGANIIQRQLLEKGFKNFAGIIFEEKKTDVQKIPGSGAAGGLAGGLFSILPNVSIVNGFEIVSSLTKLEKKIKKVDYVITAEGQIDEQTIHGKAPYGVAMLAKKHQKKVIAVAGKLGEGWQNCLDYFEIIYTLTGQIGTIRNSKAKLEIPFDHKIALLFNKMNISEKYSLKNTSTLIEQLTPVFLKDFI